MRLSCGDEVVESARLPSSGGCVNWWESCGAGQGVELPPLDFRRLSHHDISQVPDVFANDIALNARVVDDRDSFDVPEREDDGSIENPTTAAVEDNKKKWGYQS